LAARKQRGAVISLLELVACSGLDDNRTAKLAQYVGPIEKQYDVASLKWR
jgi:hypothetical protein